MGISIEQPGSAASGLSYDSPLSISGTTVSFELTAGDGLLQYNNNGAIANAVNAFWDDGNSRLGIGELAPATALEITDTAPYITLHNSTEEDGDTGRESRIDFKGEQSGGEETTLARIQAQHGETADDQKGELLFLANDGSDGDTPTLRFKIDHLGNIGVGTREPFALARESIFYNPTLTGAQESAALHIENSVLGESASSARGLYMRTYCGELAANTFATLMGIEQRVILGEALTEVRDGAGVQIASQAVATQAIGNDIQVVNNTSHADGSILTAIGTKLVIDNTGSGIIRNAYGIVIEDIVATGADAGNDHNAYALYIQNRIVATGGDDNYAYAIYSTSTDGSYMNGGMGLKVLPVDDSALTVGEDINLQNNYSVQSQTAVGQARNSVPSSHYHFDGVTNKITIADDADLNFGTGDWTAMYSVRGTRKDQTYGVLAKRAGVGGWEIHARTDGSVTGFLGDGVEFITGFTASIDIIDDLWHTSSVVFTAGDAVTIYIDGYLDDTKDISGENIDSVSAATDLKIGTRFGDTKFWEGDISGVKFFNLGLTAAEVKEFQNGAIPFKYQGANQTELSSGSLTVGKAYRITARDGEDFTADGAANNNVGTEFVATDTNVTLDANDKVVRIGCVAEYDESSMTASTWYDKSGNGNHGTVTGATIINKQMALEVSDDLIVDTTALVVTGGNVEMGGNLTVEGEITGPRGSMAYVIDTLPNISGAYVVDLEGNPVQKTIALDDISLTASGLHATNSRSVNVFVTASGTGVGFTFDSDWKWLTTKPATLADATTGLLSLMSIGDAETDIIAAYEELGDGS